MAARFELFHVVSEPGSAQVRRFITDHALLGQFRFRNLTYPEVLHDFQERGGTTTPALWDGRTLVQGAPAVLARLGEEVKP